MTETCFTLFDTAIGACAIAWGDNGVVALSLPERSEPALRTRLMRKLRQAREAPPSSEIASSIEHITRLLRGENVDLSPIRLDMTGVPDFHQQVYAIARTIPPGRTMTYGDIAARLGGPQVARAVGQALGHNPFPIVIPCHRVLAANGKAGGFSADGGVSAKMRMLTIEGAGSGDTPTLFDHLPLAVRPASRR